MKYRQILGRLTGISTPVFGVSWEPPESEAQSARRVVTALEDRRVLFNPTELEMPEHCVHSVIEIRHLLTDEIGRLPADSKLAESLRAMRAAARKFLDGMMQDRRIVEYGMQPGHYASWVFLSAIGEMRGVFGVHIAQIAVQYGLDVEDNLASILPGEDAADET